MLTTLGNQGGGEGILDLTAIFISAGSLAVAVFSMGFAIWSSRQQQIHNRLSVRPVANIRLGNFKDRVFVELRNGGTGPMILKALLVSTEAAEALGDSLVRAVSPLRPGFHWHSYYVPLQGDTVSPDEGICLLDLRGDVDDAAFCEFANLVRRDLAALRLKLTYTDIYNKEFELDRSLEWFFHEKPTAVSGCSGE